MEWRSKRGNPWQHQAQLPDALPKGQLTLLLSGTVCAKQAGQHVRLAGGSHPSDEVHCRLYLLLSNACSSVPPASAGSRGRRPCPEDSLRRLKPSEVTRGLTAVPAECTAVWKSCTGGDTGLEPPACMAGTSLSVCHRESRCPL